jgi:hypothetical protein
MAGLEKVERVGIKYIEGWVDYDYGRYGDQRHNESSGDQLRRDLTKFKSLKEVLLSHNGADGGLDQEPGQIELLNYEENRTPSPEPGDGDDGEDEYHHP